MGARQNLYFCSSQASKVSTSQRRHHAQRVACAVIALCYNALLALCYKQGLALCYTRLLYTASRDTRLLYTASRVACALLQTPSHTAPASAVTTLNAFLPLCYKGLLILVHDLGIDSELRESWHRQLQPRQRRALRRLPHPSTREHTIVYVSIRQHLLACVSIR